MKIVLPIIIRKKQRYRSTGYAKSFASRYHSHSHRIGLPKMPGLPEMPSTPKKPGCGCGTMLLLPVIIVALIAWGLWYFVPVSKEEQKNTALSLVVETRYVLYTDTVIDEEVEPRELLAFNTSHSDTLFSGVAPIRRDGDSLNLTSPGATHEVIPAQWTRRYPLLPYGGNTMAVEKFDTTSVCKLSSETIHSILKREAQHITAAQTVINEQEGDVAYFMKTHSVIDNGFDIVARYGKELTSAKDSIARAKVLVNKAMKAESLRIRLDRRYYLVVGKTRTECLPIKQKGGVLLLKLQPIDQPDSTWRRAVPADSSIYIRYVTRTRLSAGSALKALQARHSKAVVQKLSAIDSLGTYTGRRDSLARPHGYGRFLSLQGDFYEGEWCHGERSGVGFSMIPGKRLRLGEWKEDRFLGERIAYTPERIYGIDISRYQHEKGRKRFSINWRNLRITSLGHLSKKTVYGTVNYPVRFIYIKATEGASLHNKYFFSDYENSRKYGYRTGAYHFFSTLTPGRNQAINFMRNSRYRYGDLPPVLDLEPTDKQIKKLGGILQLFRNVRSWLYAVEDQRKVRPILYVSQRFVNKYLSYAPDIQKNYEVWIARYGEYKPNVNLVYWQLSPDGKVSGITPKVDINVYNGFKLP